MPWAVLSAPQPTAALAMVVLLQLLELTPAVNYLMKQEECCTSFQTLKLICLKTHVKLFKMRSELHIRKSSHLQWARNTDNFINHCFYRRQQRNSFKTIYLLNLYVFENPVRVSKQELISAQQLSMHNKIPLNSQLITPNPTL